MVLRNAKRPMIVDVGSGAGGFTRLLRRRYPKCKVVGVDERQASKADVKQPFGVFFQYDLKEPERVKRVWINHVKLTSPSAFEEFKAMVRVLPPGTPIMVTLRRESVAVAKNAFELAGLEIRSEREWNPRMIGSEFTKEFYRQAKAGNSEKMPVRFALVKPG